MAIAASQSATGGVLGLISNDTTNMLIGTSGVDQFSYEGTGNLTIKDVSTGDSLAIEGSATAATFKVTASTVTVTVGTQTFTLNGLNDGTSNTLIFNDDVKVTLTRSGDVYAATATGGTALTLTGVAQTVTIPDTLKPTATVVLADPALIAGETTTLTVTFSEKPTGFDAAVDLTVDNGALSAGAFDATGLIYTAIFTPTANIADTTNMVTLGTGWTDAALNAPAAVATSANYTVDTVVDIIKPTAT
ncbi:Ig-like domain-containing protein, partial [Chromatium okenii]|uniref:Ig-like domain-containing protein n=1 Tax=Chromatium okenii TaxID=61644 RepID=UPI0026F07C3A